MLDDTNGQTYDTEAHGDDFVCTQSLVADCWSGIVPDTPNLFPHCTFDTHGCTQCAEGPLEGPAPAGAMPPRGYLITTTRLDGIPQMILLKAPVGAMPLRGYMVTTTLLDGLLLRAVLLRRRVLHSLHRLGLRGCVWGPRGGVT